MKWKDYLSVKKNKIEFILTIIFLSVSFASLANFLQYAESRDGSILHDPVLRLFDPIDLTWLTFSLVYFSLIIAIASLIKHPVRLMLALQVYVLIIASRIISMYLLPLNPPADIIILNDPFVQMFGSGEILTKDLFFSGHTATLSLLAIVTANYQLKFLFIFFTILVGGSVIIQHVHYTIDVIAAPFFVYSCYNFIVLIRKKINLDELDDRKT